jgi:GT2 family glycosyltransferase
MRPIESKARQGGRRLQDIVRTSWQRRVDPGFQRRLRKHHRLGEGAPEVSILVVTYNRLRMLRECLASLLQQTGGTSFEIVVWDNSSSDGTREYLDGLARDHPALRVVHSRENVGLNAVALLVKLARGFYLVEMDDDVVFFPDDWLPRMLGSFRKIPRAGYLATNVVQDDLTNGAKPPLDQYEVVDYDGVVLEQGPTGGWCTMTSLEVLARVGNFAQRRGRVFFSEDGDFADRCRRAGYTVGIVRDVVVYHATGLPANDSYGYLELCRRKYQDGAEYADLATPLVRPEDQ